MTEPDLTDFGFSFLAAKSGFVIISRFGSAVTTLAGAKARKFLLAMEGRSANEQQLLMAKATGRYKRGHEGRARQQPRNDSATRSRKSHSTDRE
jgi:hypothetical protein